MLRKSHIEGGPEEYSTAARYEQLRAGYFARLGPFYDEHRRDAETRASYYFNRLQEIL